jgi:hypothetical protein
MNLLGEFIELLKDLVSIASSLGPGKFLFAVPFVLGILMKLFSKAREEKKLKFGHGVVSLAVMGAVVILLQLSSKAQVSSQSEPVVVENHVSVTPPPAVQPAAQTVVSATAPQIQPATRANYYGSCHLQGFGEGGIYHHSHHDWSEHAIYGGMAAYHVMTSWSGYRH